ncbi:hypothetical protein [Pseudomonas sp. NFIX28]|uniref:hypothetical protein n=1 Tax=Pseudomonas sp. NFIX28 TaxID=1566235 RepID=UPI0008973DD4|nr:hypothetical protein [Pseudomonas sp. NFIX28]SDY38057.1 hypothetical protein SAMN03159453_00427 [Pseudomonas sp. NFIX28]
MKDSIASSIPVRKSIHFDQLWQQAQLDLGYYARDSWSDTAEHDPGITLLQGMSFAVSDLAYRHTLPLSDLLTSRQQSGEGLFPADFGPHQVLTGSPVTVDDYRRAILDLHSSGDSSGNFYFRDVQLLLLDEKSEDHYSYWFDPVFREFHFRRPDSEGAEPQLFILQGGYRLLVELNRGVKQADAELALRAFLADNRNVCEYAGPITWLQPHEVNVELTIELEDDFCEPATVLANIYTALESYLSPQPQRYCAAELAAQGLSNEAIYQGPRLQHGWITVLPVSRDYAADSTLSINPLASALLAMEGVKRLEILNFASGGWEAVLPAGMSVRLWGEDPLAVLADGIQVKLMKRGQQLKASKAEIEQALPKVALINEQPVLLPYGRYRDPGRNYPVSDKIPPCYRLQQPSTVTQVQHLHQFLLPFEQLLANGCDQLANLPHLLAFDRSASEDGLVMGGQWPFSDGALANTVHADYSGQLKQWIKEQRQDFDKELSIIGYLLGYFGDSRSNRTLLKNVSNDDFLTIQRGYLKQHSVLGYARNQFRTGAVSALQRRIAARLGLGKELFVAAAEMELGNLPFYLVEHISLLPQQPDARYDELQPLSLVTVDDPDSPSWLILTLDDEVTGLRPGLLIELVILDEDNSSYKVPACMVAKVAGNTVHLDLHDNRQLSSSLEQLMEAQSQQTLRWSNSKLWLKEMTYDFTYVQDQPLDHLRPWIETEPFPRNLQNDDTIAIYLKSTKDGDAITVTHARVVEINTINRQLRIEWKSGPALPAPEQQQNYRWHVIETEITDRFSFDVSLVFNSDLLANAIDPYVIEAWIKNIIQDELPCHVSAQLLWLSDVAFKDFAWTYARWQTQKNVQLGELSYNLMRLLALGMLPTGEQGINAMRIATEQQQITATQPDWDFDYIEENVLLYTPPL